MQITYTIGRKVGARGSETDPPITMNALMHGGEFDVSEGEGVNDVSRLYKYGAFGKHTNELFTKNLIFFSNAIGLNDPFECRPTYRFHDNETRILKAYAAGAMATEGLSAEVAAIRAKERYDCGVHRTPGVIGRFRESSIKEGTERCGIYCLSEVPNSILMWTHYSRNHTGFCVEFDAEQEPFCNLVSVEYREEYPAVEMFGSMTNEELVRTSFLRKAKCREYERERRAIDAINGPGLQQYPLDRMTKVIFGLRTNPSDKARIRKWISRRGCRVGIAQAVRSETDFVIDIVDLAN